MVNKIKSLPDIRYMPQSILPTQETLPAGASKYLERERRKEINGTFIKKNRSMILFISQNKVVKDKSTCREVQGGRQKNKQCHPGSENKISTKGMLFTKLEKDLAKRGDQVSK